MDTTGRQGKLLQLSDRKRSPYAERHREVHTRQKLGRVPQVAVRRSAIASTQDLLQEGVGVLRYRDWRVRSGLHAARDLSATFWPPDLLPLGQSTVQRQLAAGALLTGCL